jgi:hypothetical protein
MVMPGPQFVSVPQSAPVMQPPMMQPQSLPPQARQTPTPPMQTQPRMNAPAPQFQPAMPTVAANQPEAAPRAKIRLLAPEPSAPPVSAAKLVLPPPEKLGIRTNSAPAAPTSQAQGTVPPATPEADWNDVRARLQRLGVLSFRLDRLEQGGHRVIFLLPAGPSQHQHVEATGVTESAAVLLALHHAEALGRTQK